MTQRKFSRRTKKFVGGVIVVATAALGLSFVSSASGSQSTALQRTTQSDSNEVPQIEGAFTAAIQADRAAQAPSAATYGLKANADVSAGLIAPMVSSAVRQAQLQSGTAILTKYFSPGQAKREEIGLNNAVAAEADPKFRNLGMGASKVQFVQVVVSGDTATLQANVTAWAKFQQEQPDGKWVTDSPVNVMVYTVVMSKSASGQWTVSSMQGDFAPGEGP